MPLSTSVFLILIDPSDLGIKLVKILKVVDFPAPFGPNNPKISPFLTPKVVPFIAWYPFSYTFYISLTLMESSHIASYSLISSFLTISSPTKFCSLISRLFPFSFKE